MSGKVSGITLDIGGDITNLNKAIGDANKQSKTLENELKAVEKALKLDPTNVDLLRQRQELLGDSVENTRHKLRAMQAQQAQMAKANAANADWEKAYEPLKTEIDKTTAALKKLMRQQAEMQGQWESGQISGEEYEAFQQKLAALEAQSKKLAKEKKDLDQQFSDGHISDADYRKFQRELSKTEKELGDLEKKSKSSRSSIERLGSQMRETGEKVSGLGDKLAGLSTAAAGVSAAAIATVEGTQELRIDLGKLETNAGLAGVSLEATEDAMLSLSRVSDETDSNVEALSNLLAAGVGDNQMQKAVENLSGAVVKFPDTIKIESLADGLQETLATGSAVGQFGELLDRLGIGADQFNEQLQACSTQSQRVDLALSTLSNAGMADVYQTYQQNNREAGDYAQTQYELQKAMSDLGAAIQPLVTEGLQLLVKVVSEAAKWFGSLSDSQKKTIGTVTLLVSALAPVLFVISSVFKTISNVSNGIKGLGAIAELFTSGAGNKTYLTFVKWSAIILGVVAAVTMLVIAINVLIGRGDQMSRTLGDMGNAMPSGGMPHYAKGTKNHPGGLALVGEQGAELVSLPRGARVYTNRETRDLLGGRGEGNQTGGDTFYMNVTVQRIEDMQTLLKLADQARRMERMGSANT